ncbi:MAG: cytochrome o ubiquinol oxidase subunit IV [Desulfobacterales bacterium]
MNRTPIDSAGAGRGTFKSYATGFILSILLTAIAFALAIQAGGLPRWTVLTGIFGAAILQMLVHLHYFLHLDTSSAARWNVLALVITLFIMILFIALTLWIMANLDYRMM